MSFRALQSMCYVLYTPRQCLDYDTEAKVSFASLEYIKNRSIVFYFIAFHLYFTVMTVHEIMKPLLAVDYLKCLLKGMKRSSSAVSS